MGGAFMAPPANQIDIFEAARSGDVEVIIEMVNINSDTVNATDERGYSPLILAAYNGQHKTMAYLITAGANVNYESPQGTALAGATFKADTLAAQLLLENKAMVDAVDANGTNPILFATIFNHNRMAHLLMRFGANPSIPDNEGLTAKACAKSLNNTELIKLFDTYKN